jgi:putative tryptophan/tyrosine transport system substrate-binding protein
MSATGPQRRFAAEQQDVCSGAGSPLSRSHPQRREADLPVQAPTNRSLVIKLKTAKALGITGPALLLAICDVVIR